MYIIHVHVHVKPEAIDKFKEVTLENARNSVLEPGIVQFECFQQTEDPTRFTLVEVYRTPEDQLLHRETQHYKNWRDVVGFIQVEPRLGVIYRSVYPDESEWK